MNTFLQVRDNFHLTERMRSILDGFAPARSADEGGMLPYLFWAIEVHQLDGERIVKRTGPGYILGMIDRESMDDGVIVARDDDRLVAFALEEPYDDRARYRVDCVDRAFIIETL